MRARRRPGERDRPATRAAPARQRPLGHRPDDLHVGDLRPPRARGLRAIQPSAAATAFCGRVRVHVLTRVRIPLKALPRMTRLASPLAVLPALTLGLLPRPPRLFDPYPLLRGRRPGVGAVHRQAALDLRQPQLQTALPVQRRLQSARQNGDLLVLRPDHSPQPRDQVPLLASRPRLTGHEPQACSTRTKSSTTRRAPACSPRSDTAVAVRYGGVTAAGQVDDCVEVRLPRCHCCHRSCQPPVSPRGVQDPHTGPRAPSAVTWPDDLDVR